MARNRFIAVADEAARSGRGHALPPHLWARSHHGSVVHGAFVPHMPDRFDLEGAVRHVEVSVQACIESVEDLAAVLIVHLVTVDHHVRREDRKSTRLNSSHVAISYAVFCLKKTNI